MRTKEIVEGEVKICILWGEGQIVKICILRGEGQIVKI